MNGISTTTNETYDSSFNSTQVYCYSLCSAGPATLIPFGMKTDENITDYTGQRLRDVTTHYKWQSDPSYLASNIMNAVDSSTVFDGQGNQMSQTITSFDESTYVPSGGEHGHATTVLQANNKGAAIVSRIAWTATGMVDHVIDARGNTSAQFAYGSQYGGLYPTTVTNALGQATNYGYDFNTGQVTTITDPNHQTTTNAYYLYGWLKRDSISRWRQRAVCLFSRCGCDLGSKSASGDADHRNWGAQRTNGPKDRV